jgi:hypothetical protein
MKGYIYPMFRGADPGRGWVMTDPVFAKRPTLGACMPNIRRVVTTGDYIFVVSGRFPGVRQYIVGGFRVDEKIDALAAFHRFPENRMRLDASNRLTGNIIVDGAGNRNPLDYHKSFGTRAENYIVGSDAVFLSSASEIDRARDESLPALNRIFHADTESMSEAIARWRRLDADQAKELLDFLQKMKS